MFQVIEKVVTMCGETHLAGMPCALIRFVGCPLRCSYCDTTYAYEGGKSVSLDEIIDWVSGTGMQLVLLTGGEPLLQKELPLLTKHLVEDGYQVLVETSGALDISQLAKPVIRSLDVKCPSSGESRRNLWANLQLLRPGDVVKMIVADRHDYEYAKDIVRRYDLGPPVQVMFSPAFPKLTSSTLAQWLLKDRLSQVRINIQVHRLLWPTLENGPTS